MRGDQWVTYRGLLEDGRSWQPLALSSLVPLINYHNKGIGFLE